MLFGPELERRREGERRGQKRGEGEDRTEGSVNRSPALDWTRVFTPCKPPRGMF